eukprot:Skav229141  [mRNA]  locus=scaffold1875:163934:166662:+ [translate_table: standard]
MPTQPSSAASPTEVDVAESIISVDTIHAKKHLDQITVRLDKLDKSFKHQNDFLHGHVHKSIEDLTQSLDRLTNLLVSRSDQMSMEGIVGQKSLPIPERVVRLRTGPKGRSGTVQSLVQMQSAVFEELVAASHVVSQRKSDDDSGAKPPKTDTSHAGMHEMNEESQTHILGSTSLCSSLDEDAPRDAGSRFTLAFPSMIYLAVGLPVLGLLGLAVTAGVASPSVIGLHSTVLESIIYGLAASLCMRRMKKTLSSKNLNLATSRLHAFVAEFKVDWREVSGQEGCKYLGAWLMTVLILIVARCLGTWWRLRAEDATWDVHHEVLLGTLEILCLIVYGLSSGLVMAAAYTQSHLLLGLDKSLDCWCSNIMAIQDFKEGVRSWNVLQALLKCVGRELAGGFLILQVFGYLCFIFFLVSGIIVIFRDDFEPVPLLVEIFSGVPLLFLSCLSLRLSAHGAALTEKCRAIPSFVNQIPTRRYILDQERQYLVRFIEDSSAGFCVRNVKLTQEMVMKQIYVVGALLSATFSALSRLLI